MRYVIENYKKKTILKPEQVDSPTEADELMLKAKCSYWVAIKLNINENSEQACSIA